MCGASAEQKEAQAREAELAASQKKVYDMMAEHYGTIFGQNQEILKSLRAAFEPIIAKGPNQEGFSKEELTAMRTGASDATSGYAQQAQIAANARSAAAGGSDLPSGSREQISAMINESAGNELSREENEITQKNYATGRDNFFNANQALQGGVGNLTNASSGFANSVSGSGSTATTGAQASMEGATEIQQANSAWMGPVFGAIGSLGAAALGKPRKS